MQEHERSDDRPPTVDAGPRPDFHPTEAPALYSQDGKGYEAMAIAHYFVGSSDWLVTEYDPADRIAFGWACLGGDRQMAELGYVSLAELQDLQVPVRLQIGGQVVVGAAGVERDAHWKPVPLRDAIAEIDRRQGRE